MAKKFLLRRNPEAPQEVEAKLQDYMNYPMTITNVEIDGNTLQGFSSTTLNSSSWTKIADVNATQSTEVRLYWVVRGDTRNWGRSI